MRVSTIKLQQLTIFATLFTGGGTGTMYYLMQSEYRIVLLFRTGHLDLDFCRHIAMENVK